MLKLEITKRTDSRLLELMKRHYSQPKGFVGRSICYSIEHNNIYYGHIIGGSATLHLPGRTDFFNGIDLNNIVNNIFFHIEKVDDKYPKRNFVTLVLKEWRKKIEIDWLEKYNDKVLGFESLVEMPRTGEVYLRDGWSLVGKTKGQTCKRISGKETGKFTGQRVWDRKNLRPKLVFCRRVHE